MNYLKKLLMLLLAGVICAVLGCGESNARPDVGSKVGNRVIVASINPAGMIVRELVEGTGIEVEVLLPPGASEHTYEPRPSDAALVAAAKLIVVVDPSIDAWARKLAVKPPLDLFAMLPSSLKIRPYTDHIGDRDDHDLHTGFDPHFWTDPIAVSEILGRLAAELAESFPAHASTIEANRDRFNTRLFELDGAARGSLESIRPARAILFHESFLYLFTRYQIEIVGIVEPIPGKEPSPREIKELAEKIRAKGGAAVFIEPQLAPSAAKNLAEITGGSVGEIDPLGRTGERYEEWFLRNIEALVGAYGGGSGG